MSAARSVVEAMYAAFGAKDETALRATLHPQVIWNQCDGMPGGARRRGADDVVDGVMRKLNTTWNDFRVGIDEYVVDGGTVVVLGAYSGLHGETGKSMRAVFTHVYRVENGVVVRFDQITDTAVMVDAMRPDSP